MVAIWEYFQEHMAGVLRRREGKWLLCNYYIYVYF